MPTFGPTASDRDAFTAYFEYTIYYNTNGQPGATSGGTYTYPFYTDTNSSGTIQWNFGWGYNLTVNGTAELQQSGIGIPAKVLALVNEAVAGTVDPTLGHVPTPADLNNALNAAAPGKDWRPAATIAEQDFYTTNNATLTTNLAAQGVALGSLPANIQLSIEDIAYNAGASVITQPNGKTASIGPNLVNDLKAGNYAAATWEVALDTAKSTDTGHEVRYLADAVRMLGLTVTVDNNSYVTSVSGALPDQKTVQSFLMEVTDQYNHDDPYISEEDYGQSFLNAIDTYTQGQNYFVAYGSATNDDLDTHAIKMTGSTFQLFESQVYGGVISGFTSGKTLDLSGIGTATSATIGAGNILSVTKSDGSVLNIKLDSGVDYSSMTPNVADDGNGGTNVTLPGKVDIGFVIDTTGSMTPYISAVQADATALINAAFNGGMTNTQIGVVSFKDPQAGYPDSVVLPFTTETSLANRQQAAINAINSLSASGGGDIPEGDYSGLLLALNGSMGAWREGASIHRIVLFTDAPVKDTYLAAEVNQDAHNLGINPAALTGDPPGDPPVQVQIYTIQVGDDPTATASVQEIASDNGGEFFAAPTPADLVAALTKTISIPQINGTIAGQTLFDSETITPFAGVTLVDPTAGATDTVVVTPSSTANGVFSNLSGGAIDSSTAAYTIAGTAANVAAAVDGLVFTPTEHQVAPGNNVTTSFSITDTSSSGSSATDSTTSVVVTAASPPTITGTAAGQTTTSEAPVEPFSTVIIADPNVGSVDTLSIQLDGSGMLADGTGFAGLVNSGAGLYSLSGTAAAITSELDAMVFTPAEGAAGTSTTTTFTLADTTSANTTATDNNTTVIDIDPGANFMIGDTTTGVTTTSAGVPYSGPVANLSFQYINTSSDNLNVMAEVANSFIHTGSGMDAIDVSHVGGTNVLDGGTNSNFLVGGTGAGSFDTFFVDNRGPSADIWSTVANFHAGDAATVFGVTQNGFYMDWDDGQGAFGYTGLTLHELAPGVPTASLTLSGYTTADLTNGRLTTSFGTETDGTPYLYIHANS